MEDKRYNNNKNLNNAGQQEVESSAQNLEMPVSEPKKAVIVNCYTVNVRKGRNVKAPRIRTVRAGTECIILRVINEWAQVEFADQKGVIGYLPYEYLKEK